MAKVWRRPFRASPKNRAQHRGNPSLADMSGVGADEASVGVPTIAEELLRLAQALPAPPSKGPGRPRKDAQSVALTRQQQRYRARMLFKAQEALEKQKGGA